MLRYNPEQDNVDGLPGAERAFLAYSQLSGTADARAQHTSRDERCSAAPGPG
ncbi:hypothetical protein [Jidongwangia harbinensis]|uniref:hypothetical protein n=1 Tax=Jidongwangia harbinensis TaxID=2878561 RepID=UPI001CDA15FF|nr:hypothetical protein [Jidongwangia harbinensis]MCA2219036.1 hypothetical protein [Jidongwangia harbinensis]